MINLKIDVSNLSIQIFEIIITLFFYDLNYEIIRIKNLSHYGFLNEYI
jgi:hypothetical protein